MDQPITKLHASAIRTDERATAATMERSRSCRSERIGGLAGARLRGGDNFVGLWQNAFGIVIDKGKERLDVVRAGDPLGEREAVLLHLAAELLFPGRQSVDRVEQSVEVFDFFEEVLFGVGRSRQPVFDLIAAHSQQRYKELRGSVAGNPGQIVVDAVLNRVAGSDEIRSRAFGLIEAKRSLFVHKAVETRFQVAHRDAQWSDHVLRRRGECGFDTVERSARQILSVGETFHLAFGRACDESRCSGAHLQQPGFEIVARAGDPGLGLHALE